MRLRPGLIVPRACCLQRTIRLAARVAQARCFTLGPSVSPNPDPTDDSSSGDDSTRQAGARWRILESAATTLVSLLLLGVAGFSYHKYYKWLVLHKIDKSFGPGDPALHLHHNRHTAGEEDQDDHHFVTRTEQAEIDAIVHGRRAGRYYLIIGEKGNGKKGMLLGAMHKNDGLNASVLDVHADLEIFRIRLGKVLDYEFAEDFIGGLFSIKGQRDAGPMLDIERAFNKLEKVAVRRRQLRGPENKPLVLIFNNMHLLRDDADGNNLLELLQQRAEAFASAGLATFVFNSDEYWVAERLKQNARRMELMPVRDVPKAVAMASFTRLRKLLHRDAPTQEQLDIVWRACGGRLSHLAKAARAHDIAAQCEAFLRQEKTWVLNQSALIPDFDDDVLDDGKWQAGTFSLAQALVEEEARLAEAGELTDALVSLPLYRCRQILTRADFMQRLDSLNIVTIDTDCNVRADSHAMMQAFREICAEPDFQQNLDNVKDRCDAVESLHRTRELLWKKVDPDAKLSLDCSLTRIDDPRRMGKGIEAGHNA